MSVEPAVAASVLLKGLSPAMLDEIIESLLSAEPGVDLYRDEPPEGVRPNLVIEGRADLSIDSPPRLLVGVDGATVHEIPYTQLTARLLTLAVDASRHPARQRSWLDVLIACCGRIDDLLERATRVAEAVFEDNGTFADWRAEFTAGRHAEPEDPLRSLFAVESDPPAPFLADLGPGVPRPGSALLDATPQVDHPFGRLIAEHGLTGHHIDIILLCLTHELDPRYGRRFAYLQRDLGLPVPTVDLVAALLAPDAEARLDIQRELTSGPLIQSGIVSSGRLSPSDRLQVLRLHDSVLKILVGDRQPSADQVVLDPEATPRSDPGHVPLSAARTAVELIGRGLPVHLHGGSTGDRRSAALDVASMLRERLLVASYTGLVNGTASELRTLGLECIRLQARCLIEDVPADVGEARHQLAWMSIPVITAGYEAAGPGAEDTPLQRISVEVVRPRHRDRDASWRSASRWTAVDVIGGTDQLARRYGVTIDRAAAALAVAAAGEREVKVTAEEVVAALTEATVDNAGGLLTSARPTVRLGDLVLAPGTEHALAYACARIRNRDAVIHERGWDQKSLRLTGTYLLFAGPSGTGKTMAAEAIASELGLPVQYLEISSLLSRWVGEFEAAVDKIFAAAESSGAILVANEADAFLGPRTEVEDAQARYANAGTSHLLSRLEQFGGHVIFTSNLVGANNIDPAFHRRLTATIRFRLPDEEQRRLLWRSVWPTETRDGRPVLYTFDGQPMEQADLFDRMARDHAISGGSIANIARNAAFLAAEEDAGSIDITEAHLGEAARLELTKIGDFRSLMTGDRRRRAVAVS